MNDGANQYHGKDISMPEGSSTVSPSQGPSAQQQGGPQDAIGSLASGLNGAIMPGIAGLAQQALGSPQGGPMGLPQAQSYPQDDSTANSKMLSDSGEIIKESAKYELENTVNIMALLRQIFTDLKESPRKIAILAIIGILIMFATTFIAMIYMYRLLNDLRSNGLIKNPLNREAVDYNISKSMTMRLSSIFDKGVRYKFALLLLLPVLTLIISIAGIYFMTKITEPATRNTVKFLLAITLVQSVVAIIVNYSSFLSVYRTISVTQMRVTNFNSFVVFNLYKTSSFLRLLQNIPTNSFSMSRAIYGALQSMNTEDKANPDKVASALFTLNMYIHIQKIGYNNPNIGDAFDLFNIFKIFNGINYSPADFFFRQPTFMYNYSHKIREIYKSQIAEGMTMNVVNSDTGFANPHAQSINSLTSGITGAFTKMHNYVFGFEQFETANSGSVGFLGQFEQLSGMVPDDSADNVDAGEIITDDVFEQAIFPLEGWVNTMNSMAIQFNPELGFSRFIICIFIITLMSALPIVICIWILNKKERRDKVINMLNSLSAPAAGAPVETPIAKAA